MKTAIAIVIALIVLIGGYFLFARTAAQAPAPTTETATTDTTQATGAQAIAAGAITAGTASEDTGIAAPGNAPAKHTVSYNGTSFSPASLTIKNGDSVTFTNNSNGQMWVASDPHPTHQGYSGTTKDQHCPDVAGTAFDECTAVPLGGTYSFTFKKVGSWGYHNHTNHSAVGTIVVTN